MRGRFEGYGSEGDFGQFMEPVETLRSRSSVDGKTERKKKKKNVRAPQGAERDTGHPHKFTSPRPSPRLPAAPRSLEKRSRERTSRRPRQAPSPEQQSRPPPRAKGVRTRGLPTRAERAPPFPSRASGNPVASLCLRELPAGCHPGANAPRAHVHTPAAQAREPLGVEPRRTARPAGTRAHPDPCPPASPGRPSPPPASLTSSRVTFQT
ncbi:SH3 domain-binding protein 1-like [Odocoileus virginianus]|uniref:SH3 domain-binding protein 1-like n=1 Tax=Odocoileus virginianus TaxID=9874 RepID=A0ABM4HET9_ODOVR